MRIELDTHKGVILENPTIELMGTYDDPINETFTPTIRLTDGENVKPWHDLPPQPYVKGTWTDEDVQNAIDKYLNEIDLDKA